MLDETGHRPKHERAHDAGVALAIVMEVLIELLLLIGGVAVAAALLPLQPKVRLVLSFCGLVLFTVGGALFVFVMHPVETLLFLGAGAGITGAAWGYTQVTAWLARRTASAITLILHDGLLASRRGRRGKQQATPRPRSAPPDCMPTSE